MVYYSPRKDYDTWKRERWFKYIILVEWPLTRILWSIPELYAETARPLARNFQTIDPDRWKVFFFVSRGDLINIKDPIRLESRAIKPVSIWVQFSLKQDASTEYTWVLSWARIFRLLRSPRIDSKELIPPGRVAWRAGTTTLFRLGS